MSSNVLTLPRAEGGPVAAGVLAERSALQLLVRPLEPWLARADVTELCINRPAELFIESTTGWSREAVPALDLLWARSFAKVVANATRQRVDETSPLLSASLPTGERVQVVLPPACPAGTVAMSLRRPSRTTLSLRELAARGIFRSLEARAAPRAAVEEELSSLLAARDYERFMRRAVQTRQNIVVSGPTGSGKTTWTRALIAEVPSEERLITIEDAAELSLDRHPNALRLFYSKDDQGLARVSPRQLLEASLRLRPDRILLAELRSDEAFDYLRNVNSGHPGSITSVHAGSCALAFEQLALLVKQSAAGRELSRREIHGLLTQVIDVVIQFGREGPHRFIEEIWYVGERRRAPARST